jgi:titin
MLAGCFIAFALFYVLTFTASAHAASIPYWAAADTAPYGIAIDSAGNIYTANAAEDNVSKITPLGTSTVNWGPGDTPVITGDRPEAITIDSARNIYTANSSSNNVTKITPGGVSTIVGTTGDSPVGIAVDSAGNIYTANEGGGMSFEPGSVSKITPDGTSTILTGTTGDGQRAITVDSAGNIYTANSSSNNVSKITPDGVSTILGSTGASSNPRGITIDSAGNIYTANYGTSKVSKITPAGVSTILADTGSYPVGIAVDSADNIYTTNEVTSNVSKITPDGTPTIVGFTGAAPYAIGVDSAGNIYTANADSDNVSKITPTVTGGIPDIFPAPPAKPSAPTAAAGSPGSGAVTVSVTANPISAAFGAPSSYTVSAIQDASKQCVVTSPSSSCSVAGLTIGSAYTFTASATLNSWQTASSAPSNSATPTAALPDAPTSLVISAGNGSASIAFTAGVDNGAAITNYEYSTDNGSTWTTRSPAATTSPIAISDLTNGTAYNVKLRAVNSVGAGTESSAVSVTPAAAPGAPTSLTATPGDGSASIAFNAGADNGAVITNYEYSTDDGATWITRDPSSIVSPLLITGLTNDISYSIKLRARNSVGAGAASNTTHVTPAAVIINPPHKPAKPAVKWLSVTKTKTVTTLITPAAGVTYALTAKSGRKAKKGSCKNVTIKQGKKKLARRSCTIKLAKGKWLASVTPKKGSVSGTVNSKRYSFK